MTIATSNGTESPEVRAGADVSAAGGAGAGSFWLHALALLVFYLTVVIAWGQRNSWPDDLLLCVVLVPMGMLIASTLYVVYGFGLAVQPDKGQQEQLIAALTLAVGLASGQLFLMTLGLVALGTAWLRPAGADVDWTEWLKIPLILLTTLPFWLDFQGSRSGVFQAFDDPSRNPVYQLPLALTTTQNRALGYCGLLSLVLLLHGRIFWIAVPVLPVFLVGITYLPQVVPGWAEFTPVFRQAVPWLLGILVLTAISWLAGRIDQASRRLVSGDTLRRWFEERRYPPWVAVLVVAIVQTLPFQNAKFGDTEGISLAGTLVMTGLLLYLRWRTPRGPIHSRSVAMVAAALVLTLLAEFATSEPLRRLALGLVVIGLLSWHCFWPMRVFVTAVLLSIVLLAVPDSGLQGMLTPDGLRVTRILAAGLLIVLLALLVFRPLPLPGPSGYQEAGWMPPKRFAFILLGLMMLFQTASAFWPDHQMSHADENLPPTREGELPDLAPMQTTGQPATFRLADAAGAVQVSVAFPQKNPYLIESPERTLQRNGWRVLKRERVAHPLGEATALQLERAGRTAAALWWFEQGRRSFSNHLYARRVLWSSWHLADRNLRQVRLESLSITEPSALAAFAARHGWFATTGENPSLAGLR